jgi:DNA-binding GntR family transcriptional regulator
VITDALFYADPVNLLIILAMNISTLVTPMIRQTLSADVYSQLRDLLISGRVMPGEKLSLRSIADALGVSVMPVREAVHRLVAEQALEMSANRYIRVPLLTVSQFREITSIRLNLEGQAAARAAELVSPEALQEIEAIHDAFCKEFAQSAPDESRLIALNKELHFAIYNQAEMPILLQIVESLWLRIGPILNFDLRSGNERVVQRVQASHHAAMVDALKRRDPVAACESLQNDIKSAAEFIVHTGALIVADVIKPVEN